MTNQTSAVNNPQPQTGPAASADTSVTADRLIAAVAALVTVVATALGAVGITGGAAEALLRNSAGWTIVGLGALGATVALGLMAAIFKHWHRKLRSTLAVVSAIGFGAATIFLVDLHAADLRTASRPSITMKPAVSNRPGIFDVAIEVRASGLTHHERYLIQVELDSVITGLAQTGASQAEVPTRIFVTYAGPGADGNIDYSFSVLAHPTAAQPDIRVWAYLEQESEKVLPPGDVCGKNGSRPGVTCTYEALPLG